MPSTATETSSPAAIRGIVKWFQPSGDSKSNFGFITKQDGEDIFVHGKNIRSEDYPLEEGDAVEFTLKPGRDGKPTAGNVRKVRPVLPLGFKLPERA